MPALLGTRRVPYLGGAWTPLSLPGLVLWLDAAVIGQGDNTSVATWRDRSGQGNHATQGTVAHQPTYQAAGLNGHPAVVFDGVDDVLATPTFAPAIPQPVTVFVALAVTVVTGVSQYLVAGGSGTSGTLLYDKGSAANFNAFAGADLIGPARDTAPHVLTTVFSGTASVLRKDGVGGGGNAGTQSMTLVNVGSGGSVSFAHVAIGELVVARTNALAVAKTVEGYMRAKWGTP